MRHKKGIRLSVPQPCHENWSEMTESEKGRFCMSCQKEVVDFTGFSDEQILNYFSTAKGKQCGRFHPVQLNKKIVPVRNVKRASSLSLVFSSLLVLFGFRETIAQEVRKPEPTVQTTENNLISIEPRLASLPDPYSIKGVVIDSSSQEVLIGASLILEGTATGCSTDLDGRFSFTIPSKYLTGSATIKVQFIGYESKSFALSGSIPDTIELMPDYHSVILGGCFYDPVPLVDKMETLKVKTWLKSIGHW